MKCRLIKQDENHCSKSHAAETGAGRVRWNDRDTGGHEISPVKHNSIGGSSHTVVGYHAITSQDGSARGHILGLGFIIHGTADRSAYGLIKVLSCSHGRTDRVSRASCGKRTGSGHRDHGTIRLNVRLCTLFLYQCCSLRSSAIYVPTVIDYGFGWQELGRVADYALGRNVHRINVLRISMATLPNHDRSWSRRSWQIDLVLCAIIGTESTIAANFPVTATRAAGMLIRIRLRHSS
jgi:hypothetical protein